VIVAHSSPHQEQGALPVTAPKGSVMPVKKDASGRRSVQAEIEVPGTAEDVWEAIATGSGISSWFVPTEVDGRAGGATISHFGPGNSMDSLATITEWDPPRRFVAGTTEGPGPVATEWTVDARGDGCIVRVVHSWSASTDEWDAQFEGHEKGWAAFFRILRLYLTHFRGQPGSAFQLMGVSKKTASEAWGRLTDSLGLADAAPGRRVHSPAGAPPLAGTVERIGTAEHPELLLRLDQPAPGLAHFFALSVGGRIYLPIRLYLYGERGPDAVARDEPLWQAWVAKHFKIGDVH
jgi:uncharacterized protein YndB with AHSA1/START domain